MTLSNLISLLRVGSLPVIWYCLQQARYSAALGIFVFALLTDAIDGFIHKPKSKVGSFLHPFADKLLIVGLLFYYTINGGFSWIILSIFIIRDLIVGTVRWLSARDNVHLKEWVSAKLFTISQYVLLLSLLFSDVTFDNYLTPFAGLITLLAIAFTIILAVWSVIYYTSVYTKGLVERKKEGKELDHENLVILANKKSSGFKHRYRKRLLRTFSRRRRVKVISLPRKTMYTKVEKQFDNDSHIMIAGGDGSFESALNYKPFYKRCLGFFPMGAGNAFYSYFYKGNRFEYLRSRFKFKQAKLDVLELEWGKNKKTQTTLISLGIDAEVIRLSTKKKHFGFIDYLKASWNALRRSNASFDMRVKVNGKVHVLDNCVNLTLAKVPYYGFALRSLLGNVKPADGNVYALAVVNSHAIIWNKLIRIWALVLAGFGIDKAPFLSLKGKKFVVESDEPFPVQVGGEFLGYSQKVTVHVKRKQKVLVI